MAEEPAVQPSSDFDTSAFKLLFTVEQLMQRAGGHALAMLQTANSIATHTHPVHCNPAPGRVSSSVVWQ